MKAAYRRTPLIHRALVSLVAVAAAAVGILGVTALSGHKAPSVQAAAAQGDHLIFGFTDNVLETRPESSAALARDLGAEAFALRLNWEPGETRLAADDARDLDHALDAAHGLKVVLQIAGQSGAQAPLSFAARDQYCEYARSVLARYSQIRDVVIWNEPNKTHFWRPQFNADGSSAAPEGYELLLARCYDVLHGFRSDVNVIGFPTAPRGNDDPSARSNVSHSPGNFIRKVGAAYRASGRKAPLFDTVGHHVYGETSAERPWKQHQLSSTISEGDWAQLMQALWDAFNGTAQLLPGQCKQDRCVSIWYLEDGYQTAPDVQKSTFYSGRENESYPLPDFGGGEPVAPAPDDDTPAPDQATQIVDAVRLAYCQPYVGGFFNFLLVDDGDLSGWQSAPYWADQTPKDSAQAFKRVIAETKAGTTDCARLKGLRPPARFVPQKSVAVLKLAWLAQRQVAAKNDLWRFRVMSAEDASYHAVIYRLGGSPARIPVLTAGGKARRGYYTAVKFPRRRLRAGMYQIEVQLASSANPARRAVRTSPIFRIRRAKPKLPGRRAPKVATGGKKTTPRGAPKVAIGGKKAKPRARLSKVKQSSFVSTVMLSEIPAAPPIDATTVTGAQLGAPGPPEKPRVSASSIQVATLRALARAILIEVNRVRGERGLRPLASGAALTRAGEAHARFLATSGTFTHDWRPGTPFSRWVLRYYPFDGARVWGAGENLLWWPESVTATEAVEAWLQSPPHRRVMLTPRWRELGMGVIRAKNAPGVYNRQTVVIAAAEFGVRMR